jgi:RHS repeat-associated protein
VSADGGGAGGIGNNSAGTTPGQNGGSGGGGGDLANNGGTADSGQGNNGGNGTTVGGGGSGGGGGAGGAGQAAGSGGGSAGGAGLTYSITGNCYAGGGGGAISGLNGASGGCGGGAAANDGSTSAGGAGTSNTGGGGGGSNGKSAGGGAGGSGIVVLSYPTSQASEYTCGGTATTSGGNTICTFTSNGMFTVLGSGAGFATTTAALNTHYTYDPLGRILTTANAVGTTTNTYSGWTTTTTDPNGDIKDSIQDAYGNLAQIVEHGLTSNATTTYTYDAANNLANITDALGNVRNFTYDGLGDELTAQDLHASGDSTFGSWTYSYDPMGNLTSQTDPKSQVITHTYDALNRMLTEAWTGQGTQVTNTYDSCTNGIGQLCTASSTAAKDTYAYDVLGHTTSATTTIAGTNYNLGYSYDRQGNITSVTNNANGAQVNYTYNTADLVSAVNRTIGGVNSLVASLFNYSPTDQLGQVVFGSGASTTYSYNPAALYRLTRILTFGTSTVASSATSTVNYLVVAGGGGGGSDGGGGGGAGQVLTGSSLVSSGTGYTVTVGGGGTGGASNDTNGTQGGTSSFNSISATGGGYGAQGGSPSENGGNGGNGGGAGEYPTSPGTGGTGIQFNGGNGGTGYPTGTGGGGGGASAVGAAGATTGTGKGGNGLASSISGSSVTYGGGGGGGNGTSGAVSGGTGGGGTGGNYSPSVAATAGTANTGGGGGGGGNGGDAGANGGSGIVVLSYPTSQASDYTCGGTTTTSGSNTICTFTSSGTFTVAGSNTNPKLQDLNYTYDADGNILTRTDNSNSGLGQEVTYTYDDLNRLLSASTTISNTNSYDQAFTYDALGNILIGPDGTYSYQGNTGSSYANPDAVTQTLLTTGASAPTIAFDDSGLGGNGTPASSLTFSYLTNSNTNGIIVVGVDESAATSTCGTDKVTGVTDNGTALTDAGYYIDNTTTVNGALKTYYGFSPATSTHNIVVSASASCILYATAATYTGVKQSAFPDASGTGNPLSDSGAVTLFQATTTTANRNAWAILLGVPSGAGVATAGSNTTIRQQQSGNLYYADSNGPIAPAGPFGLNWSTASSTHWAANYFSLTPVVSNPGTTATTTYSYDNNGNVTAVGTTTTYSYDFDNRLIQSSIGNGHATTTTTYGYDPFGNRIFQGAGTATTTYPSQYYSIISTIVGSTTTATSTDYVYAGAALFGTIDQKLINGTATGTPVVRYVHGDNLGSTNVTSDANGNLAQWFDYGPYGSLIASTNTGTTTAARQYIGQFSDASGLSYLNARYYNGTQGQFTTEDPTFLALGNQGQLQQYDRQQSQILTDPQQLNSYAYSSDNPLSKLDPLGLWYIQIGYSLGFIANASFGVRFNNLGANYYVSPNLDIGAEIDPVSLSSGQLTPSPEVSVSRGASFILGPGINWDYGGEYDPSRSFLSNLLYGGQNQSNNVSVTAGLGASIFHEGVEYSAPFSVGVYGNLYSSNVQTRVTAAQTINTSAGYVSTSQTGSGGSGPSSDSLWVTPSGAVVTFGGNLVAPPPATK